MSKRPKLEIAAAFRGDSDSSNSNDEVQVVFKKATNECRKFWADLKMATVDESNILILKSPNPFLRSDNGGNFFVRQCFVDLFGLLERETNALVLGTPGIGKSLFLFYIMYRIQKDLSDATIILRRVCDTGIFLFELTGVKKFRCLKDLCFHLDKTPPRTNIWYLCDTIEPDVPTSGLKTVLVSTIGRERVYRDFEKSAPGRRFYMPLWTREELDNCRRALAIDVSTKTMKGRFDLIGGVPRWVFGKRGDVLNSKINMAIEFVTVQKLFSTFNDTGDICHAREFLVHVTVLSDKDKYQVAVPTFASEKVADRITAHLFKADRLAFNNLMSDLEDICRPPYEILLTHLFTSTAHFLFKRGGKFCVRRLCDGQLSSLLLDCRSDVTLKYWSDIHICDSKCQLPCSRIITPAKYYRSAYANAGGCSSFITSIGYFKVATSLSFDLKVSEMVQLVEKFTEMKTIYFVVPQKSYLAFPQKELPKELEFLEQFVVDLDTSIY